MAVIKVVEIVGTSTKSWQDAAESAVKAAAQSVRHITGVDVIRQTAIVDEGRIAEYRAAVHVAFRVEEHGHLVGVP
jgi:flavin-binding protein dodecin